MPPGNVKPILYSYYRSSCSWRVRIALAYKQIDYEYKAVNLLKGEQSSVEYKRVNARGLVPSLTTKDGHNISESMAILEYLEDAYPDAPRLLPKAAHERATVRSVCQHIVSGIQPLQNLATLKRVGNGNAQAPEAQQWGKHYIQTGFEALEQLLSSCAGRYCVGDAFSLADCCLVPQIYNANRFKVGLDAYPTISRVYDALKTHEAVLKSHPNEMSDCPEDQKTK